MGIEIFNVGTTTWSPPSGVTTVIFEVWGGGGAGNGTYPAGSVYGRGGGGGGYSRKTYIDILPTDIFTIKVDEQNKEESSYVQKNGDPSTEAFSGAGGSDLGTGGGFAGEYDVGYSGGTGYGYMTYAEDVGGGGGSAFAVLDGESPTSNIGGNGQGNGGNGGQFGSAGQSPGGGGGGSWGTVGSFGFPSEGGGAGADGLVIATFADLNPGSLSLIAFSGFDGYVPLSWTQSQYAQGYRVYRDGNPTAIYDTDLLAINDTTVTNFITYSYIVQAYNGTGTADSNSAIATPGIRKGLYYILMSQDRL